MTIVKGVARQSQCVLCVYDFKHGTIRRWGEKSQRFEIMPKAPGEYEEMTMLVRVDEEG